MSIRMLYKVKMMIGAADAAAAAPDGESSDATTPASAAASNTISFLIGFVDSFHSSFSLSLPTLVIAPFPQSLSRCVILVRELLTDWWRTRR